jgi:dihydropteroate synthase-like protein
MRVLLITGRLAERVVYESASQQSGIEFCVKVLPVSVAALITPEFISRELKDENLSDYDLIVVPGMIRGDMSIIEKTAGIPVFKGTKYASDIPVLLEALGRVELSKVDAADSILAEHLQQKSIVMLQEAEHQDQSVAKKPWNMIIGKDAGSQLFVGRDYPMRVVAEILDAPNLSDEELLSKANHYAESGAQVIDIGMLAGEPKPDDVRRILMLLKRKLKVPISIDSLNPEDIEAALRSGIDMVLSIDSQNVDKINYPSNLSDIAVVVIPDRLGSKENATEDKSVRDRVASLEENMKRASEVGFKKIIADPIMDPIVFPGIVASIIASHKFSESLPNMPLMFGIGNITELIDADSVGVNATIAGIAQELNASLLLTTEGSTKTIGAVKELATSCNIMYLAKRRNTPPKDLGIDLLRLKEKSRRDVPYDRSVEKQKQLRLLEAKHGPEPITDPKGFFKINIDHDGKGIVLSHFKGETETLDVLVRGSEPLEIRDTVIKLGLVSTLEHAYYLGAEIEKAYIALRINRSYYQDEELFISEFHSRM